MHGSNPLCKKLNGLLPKTILSRFKQLAAKFCTRSTWRNIPGLHGYILHPAVNFPHGTSAAPKASACTGSMLFCCRLSLSLCLFSSGPVGCRAPRCQAGQCSYGRLCTGRPCKVPDGGSEPKVPFWGWLPLHCCLFGRLSGCSPGHRGFDPEPDRDLSRKLPSNSCHNLNPATHPRHLLISDFISQPNGEHVVCNQALVRKT